MSPTPDLLSEAAALAADPMLPPDAYRLIMYVATLGTGEHEIDAEVLRAILRCKGDKPVYAARTAARRYGLSWRSGGRDHSNRYSFAPGGDLSNSSPPRAANDSNSPPLGATNDAYVAPRGGLSAPSSSPSPPTPPPSGEIQAREPVGLDSVWMPQLRDLLAPHADVIDLFARSAPHRPDWPYMLWLDYRPAVDEVNLGGMDRAALSGVPPDRVPVVLAKAMKDYACNGKTYSGPLFRGYVESAAEYERNSGSDGRPRRGNHAGRPEGEGGRGEDGARPSADSRQQPSGGARPHSVVGGMATRYPNARSRR